MVKYYVETKEEDFILEIPEDDKIQVIFEESYEKPCKIMQVVERTVLTTTEGPHTGAVKYNDHVLAKYEDVKAVRCELIKRVDPEVA